MHRLIAADRRQHDRQPLPIRGNVTMKVPFFSVITVCHNAAAAMPATAESLLAQNLTDYEWIVIDGASTDDTCEIAQAYLDSTRDTILSEPDDGVYDAMNKGLRIASGEFVLFLNAGDLLAEQRTLSIVREEIDETVDVLHGDVIFSLPRGDLIHRRSKDASSGVDRQLFASHQSVYVRRTLHLRYPFDTSLKISADFAAIASLHAKGAKFYYLPMPLSITVKGRAHMVWEDARVNRQVRGMSPLRAYGTYLKARTKVSVVSAVMALPPCTFHRLPVCFRKRIY
jgi:putative colanic acid biosynthesis glycosyltransferase